MPFFLSCFNNIPLGAAKGSPLTQRSSGDTQAMQRHRAHAWEICEEKETHSKEIQCRYREEESDYACIHTASCALWAEKVFPFLLLGINNSDVRDRGDWNVVQPGVYNIHTVEGVIGIK